MVTLGPETSIDELPRDGFCGHGLSGQPHLAFLLTAVAMLLSPACADQSTTTPSAPVAVAEQAAAHAGPWQIPADIREVGEAQYIAYDSAPLWDGGASCSGGLLAGSRELGDFILERFSGACQIQGYNCRRNSANPARMSVHGTGRAIDIIIPTVGGSSACFDGGGEADNDLGDPIGHWLITHAEEIGIQYIIWDWWSWTGNRSGRKDRVYCSMDATRCHPHHNHLHVELTIDAANRRTPWFTERCSEGGCDEEEPEPGPVCEPAAIAGAEEEIFKDVAPTTFGWSEINALWRAEITNGCRPDPRLYCPQCPTTRYAMVVFLLRAADIDLGEPPETPTFSDVATTDWFYPYVEAAARERITTGCSDTLFCPQEPVTRGQAAAFIRRTKGWPALDPTIPTFSDVPDTHLFYRDIETIADWCVTYGCGSGNYCPEDTLTRDQAAVMVARAFDLEGANPCFEGCDTAACSAQSWCGEWSPCTSDGDNCDETGTKERSCHDFACTEDSRIELCEEVVSVDQRACTCDIDAEPDDDVWDEADVAGDFGDLFSDEVEVTEDSRFDYGDSTSDEREPPHVGTDLVRDGSQFDVAVNQPDANEPSEHSEASGRLEGGCGCSAVGPSPRNPHILWLLGFVWLVGNRPTRLRARRSR